MTSVGLLVIQFEHQFAKMGYLLREKVSYCPDLPINFLGRDGYV